MGSVRRRGDAIRVTLETAEVTLLIYLVAQVHELLADSGSTAGPGESAADAPQGLEDLVGMSFEPVDAPEDPVMKRLLPDAYREDGEASDEFRRLTDHDLRAVKRAGLSQIVTDLSDKAEPHRSAVRLTLTDEEVSAWLPALTSLRLAIGTRIDVTEDMDDERESLAVDSPRYAEIATYDWLSWLQDAMVRALTGD
jgi:hypothetical protein